MDQWIKKTELLDGEAYTVRGQEWTEEALLELRTEHNIVLLPDSVTAVKIDGSMLTIGIEDDGTLFFRRNAPSFHAAWSGALIQELEEAASIVEDRFPF